MERHVMWTPVTKPGFEHLKLVELPNRVTASGLIIGLADGEPYRIHYEIGLDNRWHIRRVEIEQLDLPTSHGLYLITGGDGHWATADGEPLPDLADCSDIDIAATPFTNTISIRRLGLKVGETTEINSVYITVPDFKFKAFRQRYTCLALEEAGGKYLYEGITTGYKAEIQTDRDGIVIEYPKEFTRVLFDGGH